MTENAGIENVPVEPGPGSGPELDATQRMEDPTAVEEEPERLYEA
jgi:hypothetical protein